MPDAEQYAERQFAHGFGRRAAFGCCADCGNTLRDVAELVCKRCRRTRLIDEWFLAREAGHRERVTDLFRGVRDSSLTFEKVEAMYQKKLKAKEGKVA